MITLHDIPQGSEAWHEARKGKFTGSNAHKLLSSFGAHEYARSIESDFTGNFYTERGHLLEDEAISLYEQIKKEQVSHCGFITNSNFPDCLYSPDGYIETQIIEVKCFSETPHLEIWRARSWLEVPKKIIAQIQFGMMISEKQAAQLIIYNPRLVKTDPKYAFKIIDVPYNQKIIDNFKRILEGVRV